MYEQPSCSSSLTLSKAMLLQEHTGLDHCSSCSTGNSLDRSSTSSLNLVGTDARGQTPLHRCIRKGQGAFAKLLLSRYLTCSYLCHGCLLISSLFGCHFCFMAYQSYITFYVSHQSLFPTQNKFYCEPSTDIQMQ